MSCTYARARDPSPPRHVGTKLTAVAVGWRRAYVSRRKHRTAIAELHALDDRLLRDMGISRLEIMFLADNDSHDPTRRSRA
jgi:uncharacterized protein YjiS (DUF1127 family)